jgi:hypothetical protein
MPSAGGKCQSPAVAFIKQIDYGKLTILSGFYLNGYRSQEAVILNLIGIY